MQCPGCQSENTRLCKAKTSLGYLQYRCQNCNIQFNEYTHTAFNFIQYSTEVVMLAVHYYYRFRNSLDDVVELMAMRGLHLCHQTVHNWIQTFGVELGIKLRERRQGKAGKK
jgi:transposase-like protein